PFWKNTPDSINPLVSQLYREQQKLLRDLLGDDADSTEPMTGARQKALYSHLSPEKAAEVRGLVRQFNERRSELNELGDTTKLQALEKEQRATLAALLTPDELFEHDLRTHRTATTLRNSLSAFQPTEAEFRAIFKLQRDFDEPFPPINSVADMLASRLTQNRGETQRQLAEQIKTMLGPERGVDYERTSDSSYRRTDQLVARLQLPPETTQQLWAAQKEYQQRRTDMMRNPSPPEERATRLTALQQEAVARVASLLGGERNVEAYKQYGGFWLQNLVPRPIPSPTK
ncbi:MAG: hypothetical protein ABIZ49_02455, partial [Opitutaceae bacterium]